MTPTTIDRIIPGNNAGLRSGHSPTGPVPNPTPGWPTPPAPTYDAGVQSLPPAAAERLGVIAQRLVPEFAGVDDDRRRAFEAIVDHALAARPASVRRQIAVFLGVVDRAPVLRWGRTFRALDGDRQDRVLRWFQDGPVGLFRSGFWGLRTLVFMGFYGQRAVWQELGYAPRLPARDGADG